MRVKVWIHCFIGDTAGNNKWLGQYPGNREGVRRPHHDCKCQFHYLSNLNPNCIYLTMDNINLAKRRKQDDDVCVCVLTCSPVQGGFANNTISIAGQSLKKIKVLPKIPNRTPAGCRPVDVYSSPSSLVTTGPTMRAACAISKSIDCAHQNWWTLDPRLLTPSIQV